MDVLPASHAEQNRDAAIRKNGRDRLCRRAQATGVGLHKGQSRALSCHQPEKIRLLLGWIDALLGKLVARTSQELLLPCLVSSVFLGTCESNSPGQTRRLALLVAYSRLPSGLLRCF